MEYLLQALSALKIIAISVPVLCVLIFVHELGHFLLAKFFRVGVLTFSIGFGKILWARRYGETLYSIRALPLGGYVRMVGDDPREVESGKILQQPSDNILEPAGYDALSEAQRKMVEDKSRWFLNKGFWPKFLIVFAGPAFNIIFAIVLAIFTLWIFGQPTAVDDMELPAQIDRAMPGHPADKAGILSGDIVRSIDGNPVNNWKELSDTVRKSGGKKLTLLIDREVREGSALGAVIKQVKIEVVAEPDKSGLVNDEERESGDVYRIGISPVVPREPVSLSRAVPNGFKVVWYMTEQTVWGLKGLVTGAISLDNVAGPIGIFKETSTSAERGIDRLLGFMVFLSVSLAVLNLLPIPVLDGGHILFFLIELVKGSPVSLRVREVASQVGMVLLLLLMILAIGNDITR